MWRGPLAYGQATDMRMRSAGLMRDDKRNLASHGLAKGGQHLRGSAAEHLLVHLRQLACERQAPLRQRLRERREGATDPVRGLEDHRRAVGVAQTLEEAAQLARLARQVAGEAEPGA